MLAGDKLYCTREDGMVFVVGVTDGFKLLAENDMGEKIIATPVPVRDGLLIRGEEHLFRVGGESATRASPAAAKSSALRPAALRLDDQFDEPLAAEHLQRERLARRDEADHARQLVDVRRHATGGRDDDVARLQARLARRGSSAATSITSIAFVGHEVELAHQRPRQRRPSCR